MSVEAVTRIKNEIQRLNQASLTANAKIEVAKTRLAEILKTHDVQSVEELQAKVALKETEVARILNAAQDFIRVREQELNEIQDSLNGV